MDTYNLLVQRIANRMNSMNEDDALSLAFKITESVNLFLAGQRHANEDSFVTELIPDSVRSHAILGIGWDAHRLFKNDCEILKSKISFLSTMPSSYRLTTQVAKLRVDSGIWAGSLLSSISEIINTAENELFIIAPYWSSAGMRSLISNFDCASKNGLSVSILTQSRGNLREDEITAINDICLFFLKINAKINVFSPNSIEGKEPLLHAKAVIADSKAAYIGSANYTASGIEHSIEIGIRVDGGEVKSLVSWALFLLKNFSKWDKIL